MQWSRILLSASSYARINRTRSRAGSPDRYGVTVQTRLHQDGPDMSDHSYIGSRRAGLSLRGECLYLRVAGATRWQIAAMSCELQRAADRVAAAWKRAKKVAWDESDLHIGMGSRTR